MGKWFFHVNAGELMTAFDFGVSLLGTIVYFWSLAYLVVAVSEIHAFSKWKGFFTLAIVIIPLALLGLS